MIDVYELASDENQRNPYPLYARMRDDAPVLWCERLSSWFVSRYRDCHAVLRDPQRFGVDRRQFGVAVSEESLNLQTLDRPAHTPVRNLFVGAYRAQDFAALAVRARRRADELLDTLVRRPAVDLMSEYGAPLGLEVSCDFLGVEPPEVGLFGPLADAVVQSFDGRFFPDLRAPGDAARGALSELLERIGVRAHEQGAKRGFVGYLLDHHEAVGVPRRIVFNSARVGLLAGYIAVTSSLANALKVIFERGVPIEILADDARADLALEELFRYEGPVQGMMRFCYEDTEIGDQQIRRGEGVTLLVGAANRDPEQFARADELVLERAPNPHLAFGWGMHACIGGSLAKLIVTAALARLAARAPGLRLLEPLVPRRQVSHRAPRRVLVGWQ